MRYKTAFRLALRAIGIWLICTGIPDLLGNVGFALEFVGGPVAAPWAWWPRLAGDLLRLAFGAYLLFGGRWLANLAIPSNRPYCAECGYELTGLRTAGRCPECGTPFGDANAPGVR
jgi:hypothetical protein